MTNVARVAVRTAVPWLTLARSWIAATGRRRLVLPLPAVGKIASGFRQGLNCAPDKTYGRITWTEWLAARYGTRC